MLIERVTYFCFVSYPYRLGLFYRKCLETKVLCVPTYVQYPSTAGYDIHLIKDEGNWIFYFYFIFSFVPLHT